jgi:hypothetical protein
MCEDHQEVARSTLVKGIELKMAALIWWPLSVVLGDGIEVWGVYI